MHGDDVQDGAAPLQLFQHVMRRKAAVLGVGIGQQDDDRTIEVAHFFRGIEHRFDDAAAVRRLGPTPSLITASRSRSTSDV